MPEHQQTNQSKESKYTAQKQATRRIQSPISHPMAIIQRAKINPKSLTHADVMQLQQTIGNRAVVRLLSEIGLISSRTKQEPPVQMQTIPKKEKEPLQGKMVETIQCQEIPEEEKPLQGKVIEPIQRQEILEEEEPLQGKFESIQRQEIPEEEEPLQGKFESVSAKETCPSCIQRQEIPEEEEPLQGKMDKTTQLQEIQDEEPPQIKKENNTGMPDNLKAGVENLSGIDMSDVRVHYNSSKPADVGALAYTQGTNIHVAPGQERHLPHEAWHVVQQKLGKVKPTKQLKNVTVNDDVELEHEADVMGKNALFTQKKISENNEKCTSSQQLFPVKIHTPNRKNQVISTENVTQCADINYTSRQIEDIVRNAVTYTQRASIQTVQRNGSTWVFGIMVRPNDGNDYFFEIHYHPDHVARNWLHAEIWGGSGLNYTITRRNQWYTWLRNTDREVDLREQTHDIFER